MFPEYFENYYARIGREPGSYFALGRTDGTVLARFPAIDRDIRLDPRGPIGKIIAANPTAGLVTVTSPVDGIERRLGYRRLAEYPIYVGAGLETSAIRARWLSTMSQHLIFGAPATALLFALLGLALRRTRHLHFEAEKRQVAEEALKHGQRLEALGQLTGGVAHDFNNLLTVIRASVDLLRRPDLPEPRRLRYIEAISDTVTRAAKLTGQLLAFARRQTLKPEVFEVGRSVQTLSEMIGTLIGSRIEIVILGPEEPCFVNADAGQFETAIINMAVNARDAMEGRGRLTIAVGMAASLPNAAAPVAKSLWLCCRIRRRHRQRHSTGSVRTHLRTVLHDQAGRPWHRARPVAGIRFRQAIRRRSGGRQRIGQRQYFHAVPAAHRRQRQIATDAGGRCAGARRTGMSVLVVEDNAEVGRFATDALADLGYTTRLVSSAAHALEELAADAGRFDVVFTDVVMPR